MDGHRKTVKRFHESGNYSRTSHRMLSADSAVDEGRMGEKIVSVLFRISDKPIRHDLEARSNQVTDDLGPFSKSTNRLERTVDVLIAG
jgi:hypothetical protein